MTENKLNMEIIKSHILNEEIYWTKHCLNRLNQRNISILDVKTAIFKGKIIEYYFEDYPYMSCLILGYTLKDIAIHIVCGIEKDSIYIITVYYPDSKEWKEDKKTRRKNNELF